jgi:alkaline phosphatase D
MYRVSTSFRHMMALAVMSATLKAVAPPIMEQGIQIGDVTDGRAIIWSRADRPSRMMVEYALDSNFTNPISVRGPYATPESDFTARQDLTDLPRGKDIYVKAWFEDLTNDRS